MTALPLRAEAPASRPLGTFTVDCPNCGGTGERERIINLKTQQDSRIVACADCQGGKVTYQVGYIGEFLFGFDERNRTFVNFEDEASMLAGVVVDIWPANPRTVSGDEILEACGVAL